MSELKLVASLTCDPRLQMRECLNAVTVERYAEAIRDNDGKWPFPPIQTVGTFVADGWHRLEAAKRCGLKEVPVADHGEKLGPEDDRFEAALVLACGANEKHGLPRTNADKRRAVVALLQCFPDKSLREIARLAVVSHTYVNQVQRGLELEGASGNVSTSAPSADQASEVNPFAELDSCGLADDVSTPSPSAAERHGCGTTPAQDEALGSKANTVSPLPTPGSVTKRPLLDSITDAIQALGTLNKHLVACKSLDATRYYTCRVAMKTIDESLEQWLEDAKKLGS